VKAEEEDVVAIVDHFKPGVAEFAALLPRTLADRLLRWDRARVARGRDAFALPLKIRADTAFGLTLLRLLAAMKGLRRRGSRFAQEQAMIERWLAAVEAGARRHPSLGFELAACGRLVKGYGATNERGKANLLHVIDHLASAANFATDTQRADAVRQARVAALADEAGTALDQTLLRHGAPPRPVQAQPIRWVGARPGRPEARAGAHDAGA
jgi:indolepyruvate ferredoxin oxidoreductase beta subunit